MPKPKATDKKVERKKLEQPEEAEKIIEIAEEDTLDDEELVDGEDDLGDAGDEEATLDVEDVDPFNDKWEQ